MRDWGKVIPWQSMLILALGVLLAFVYVHFQNISDRLAADNTLAMRSQAMRDTIQRTLQSYEYGLRGTRGFALTQGQWGLTHDKFRNYMQSRDMALEFPGASGFGLIRRVLPSDLQDYLQRTRIRDGQSMVIRELDTNPYERYVIELIEPAVPNANAIGLDVASEPSRRMAAQAAMRSGKATLSAPITLVQAANHPSQGLLFMLPIYDAGKTPDTAEERERRTWAWAYAPLLLDTIWKQSGLTQSDFVATLRDSQMAANSPALYESRRGQSSLHPGLRHNIGFPVHGRHWELTLEGTEAFWQANRTADIPARVGVIILLSVLGAAAVAVWQKNRARHAMLMTTRSKIAAIVDSSLDAIISKDLNDVITSWNASATSLFGYTAEEAIGQRATELLLPPGYEEEQAAIRAAILDGQPVHAIATRRRRKDGSEVAVSASMSPIRDNRGTVTGISKTLRDITQQQAAEDQLARAHAELERTVAVRTLELDEARRRLMAVLDGVPSMIGYWDKQLVNQVANHAYHSWFGVSPAALPGTHMKDLLGDQWYQDVLPHVRAALAGHAQRFERRIPRADGELRDALAYYLPDERNGVVEGFYVIVHDVTDLADSKRQLNAALQLNKVTLDTIGTQLLYTISDEDGCIIVANDRFCQLHQAPQHEVQGQSLTHFMALAPESDWWQQMKAQLVQGKVWRGELCHRASDGGLLWFDTVMARLPLAQESQERFIALRVDISDRKHNEAEVARLNALLSNVLASATGVAIIATDINGTIELFNSGAEQMLGYSAEEMLGRCTPSVLHLPQEVTAQEKLLSAALGRPVSGFRVFVEMPLLQGAETRAWTYLRKDGSQCPVSLTVTTLRGPGGDVSGFLGVAFDMSQQKEIETSLVRARDAAESASQAKGEFLANMSHEIRTPMNAVLGMLQILARTPLGGEQAQYVAKARLAGTALLGVIDDILDFSKIEAGQLMLDEHEFRLGELLDTVTAALDISKFTPELQLLIDDPPAVTGTLRGDSQRLRQILLNLMGNAIKFTHQGHVMLEVHVVQLQDQTITLAFAVSDTGIGIAADKLETIFDGFTQAESSISRRYGGSGLGLAICRTLVHMMGGTLSVESAAGVGSTFRFVLQLGYQPKQEPPPVRHRILVAEDNPMQRAILDRMLQAMGCEPLLAAGSAETLAALVTAEVRGAPCDLVLIDYRLAGDNGLELAETIRQASLKHPPRLLMMTAYAESLLADPVRQRQLARTPVLHKPLTARQLAAAIDGVFSGGMQPPPEAGAGLRLAGWTILLVEDQEINRQVAAQLLSMEGAQVLLAQNGTEGVQAAHAYAANIDAILMDLQMPELDGLTASMLLQADAATAHLPIVAMTANASKEDEKTCRAAGMQAYITKPFDIGQLVTLLLGLHGVTSVPGTAVQPAGSRLEPLANTLRRYGQHLDICKMALSRFEEACSHLLQELAVQTTEQRADKVADCLHGLKGLASTVGAAALAGYCSQHEALLREGQVDMQDYGSAWQAALQADICDDAKALLERAGLLEDAP